MLGWQPWISWCDGHGLQLAALYILGYGLKVRAALQLESDRRYVRTAVPEGGGLGQGTREQWKVGAATSSV
jgi:hypothetical protein